MRVDIVPDGVGDLPGRCAARGAAAGARPRPGARLVRRARGRDGATWGAVRGFRFRRPDGSYTDLALADRDARCWAGAVDRTAGLTSSYGLSLCLRLLALVDLLARARGPSRCAGWSATAPISTQSCCAPPPPRR